MSRIASPRRSGGLPPSRPTSASTDNTALSGSTTRNAPPNTGGEQQQTRRNRAALRDYYNLKPTDPLSPHSPTLANDENDIQSAASILDQPDFDSKAYVTNLIATSGLEHLLSIEARLVSEIRGLDAAKKSLVYDNYSKLIAASDTIEKVMRGGGPSSSGDDGSSSTQLVAGDVGSLGPALERIVQTAVDIAAVGDDDKVLEREERRRRLENKDKADFVRWVLGAPDRLTAYKQQGRMDEAEREWSRIQTVLARWDGVKGIQELRDKCLDILSVQNPT